MQVKAILPKQGPVRFGEVRSGQVMIKHPNTNDMQLEINTSGYIPKRYVKEVTVKRDGELAFDLDATFSISKNPKFRFSFAKENENDLDVTIVDTDRSTFEGHTFRNK